MQPGFHPLRQDLAEQVDAILATAADGRVHRTTETQDVDFKEEAGRRNGPEIEPGQLRNPMAATKLADEVACMANTPGGGALIVGVEDKTGRIIGTELDVDWLRQEFYQRVQVAPSIEERVVEGQRLLILFVAASQQPVPNTSDQLRWRVGDSCKPVDLSEWWEYQRSQMNIDPMAQASDLGVGDVRPRALEIVRRQQEAFRELTDEELLRGLGALDANNNLTQAGVTLFAATPRAVLELTIFDVHGGNILNRVSGNAGTSTLEQLEDIEQALRIVNKNNTIVSGFVHQPIPQIPHSAVREALLNAMIHRDWNRQEPVDVRWIELDSTLIVRSPGPFMPAISAANVLSNREARYPALADLYRAIGLVDKQGVGVDRMYQSMITLGHRPPEIIEVPGPYIETTLVGGQPELPVLDLVSRIVPTPRQRDTRIAIILYLLFNHAFITRRSVAEALQSTEEAAELALTAAHQTTVNGEPLIRKHGDAWLLNETSRAVLRDHESPTARPAWYLGTDPENARKVVLQWLSEFGEIRTADLVELCDISRSTATNLISGWEDDGLLVAVGGGRSRRYRKGE